MKYEDTIAIASKKEEKEKMTEEFDDDLDFDME